MIKHIFQFNVDDQIIGVFVDIIVCTMCITCVCVGVCVGNW